MQTAVTKPSGASPVDPRAGFDVERTIRNKFESILSGKEGSFTEERLALESQKLSEAAVSRKERLTKELDRDLIRRGVFNSGIGARSQREINLAVEKNKSNALRELKIKKLAADWSDKMNALGMAQKWLDSRRSYEIGKEQIAATRESTRARTALGYAQIAAGKENARTQAGAARAALGLNRERFTEDIRRYEESKIPIPPEMQSNFGGQTALPPVVFSTVFGAGVS